jgi:hypothetical protein
MYFYLKLILFKSATDIEIKSDYYVVFVFFNWFSYKSNS